MMDPGANKRSNFLEDSRNDMKLKVAGFAYDKSLTSANGELLQSADESQRSEEGLLVAGKGLSRP